jgi:pimeloyl-ACP methyl ester carboxylesterase
MYAMKMLKQSNSLISSLVRKVRKAMLILCSFIILCIVALLVILLIQSPGKVKPLLDENGIIIKGSISEKVYANINGVNMGMIIKSKDISNPVLLFVHGGPGMPEYEFTEKYPTGLEENFTVVWWEQRGSGLSYDSDTIKEKMTSEQFVLDTIEVSKYLCERFGKEKIYLMAHSWGTYIGIQAAEKAPELFYAYIGMGQTTNQLESEKAAYDYMVNYYKDAGDDKIVNKLQGLSFKDMDYIPKEYDKIRDDVMHKAGIGTMHKMNSVISGIFMTVMENPEYTLGEKINIWRGKAFSKSTNLHDELHNSDLRNKVTKLKIPVYFFSGIYDYTVNYSMAEDYLKKIDAPIKGFYLFKESAHSPIFEEPKKMMQIMQEDVINKKNNLADTY